MADGRYWFNKKSGEAVWNKPDEQVEEPIDHGMGRLTLSCCMACVWTDLK